MFYINKTSNQPQISENSVISGNIIDKSRIRLKFANYISQSAFTHKYFHIEQQALSV